MKLRISLFVGLAPLVVAGLAACTTARPATVSGIDADLAIVGVTVVDVERGALLPDRTVLVTGNRITRADAAPVVRVPAGAQLLDGRGRFLIPGLWDMHVHTARAGRATYFWPLFLTHGVTGVRETGSYLDSLVHWRDAARASPYAAPRVVWSSPMLDGDPPSYRHGRAVSTPEQARAVVAEMEALGFDYLKIYNGLSGDVFLALADEARRRIVPIAGEVPDAVSPVEAAEAGMRSFEHLWNLFEFCVPGAYALRDSLTTLNRREAPEAERRRVRDAQYRRWLEGYDPACADTLTAELRRSGTWQVPTLAINRSYSFMDSTWTHDPRRRWVPRAVLEEWDELREETLAEYGPLGIRAWRARYAHEADMLRRMAAAGVGILAGSDVSDEPFIYAGSGLHDEMTLLVEAGLTPLQALQAATLGPARFLAATDSLGTVAVGKLADLVLLDGNPLDDIEHVRRIHAVVRNGRLYDRAALSALLEQARLTVEAMPSHLYVWTASADSMRGSVLATFDIRPGVPENERLVAMVPAGTPSRGAHHTEHALGAEGLLFANAFGSGRTFLFDVREPLEPRLLHAFGDVGPYSHPHSFERLPGGHTLATFQWKTGGALPGGLVELDRDGRPVRWASAAPPTADSTQIVPYSLVALPALDRVVTSSTHMIEDIGVHVQVWRLSDLELLHTLQVPLAQPAAGAHEGHGPDAERHRLPAEPRVLADGRTVMFGTFTCGLYHLVGVETDAPRVVFSTTFPSADCAVPVVVGRWWIQTVSGLNALVALDVSDPAAPVEVSRLILGDDVAPHWLAADASGRLLVTTSASAADPTLRFVAFDPATGKLSLDAERQTLDLRRVRWPDGYTGRTVPHGSVFSLPPHQQ